METRIEFIKGNFYRTSLGEKAELIWICPKNRQMLFVCPGTRSTFWLGETSEYIIGPWREPAQVRVVMYRNQASGTVRVWDEVAMSGFPPMDGWDMIGEWTLTEGTENAVPA